MMVNWNLLLPDARVQVRNTDAEPIESHVWAVWGDDGQGYDIVVPVGETGRVVEYDGDNVWLVRWDDPRYGHSSFNEPLAALAIT